LVDNPCVTPERFPIRFEAWYAVLSSALFLSPRDSYVDVKTDEFTVRMGWAFRATLARSSVVGAERYDRRPLSRGVHGLAGRWLVNGSGDGIVVIRLADGVRGKVLGVPVRLRELLVSVEEPDRFVAALT
jgi:hypothetical protein